MPLKTFKTQTLGQQTHIIPPSYTLIHVLILHVYLYIDLIRFGGAVKKNKSSTTHFGTTNATTPSALHQPQLTMW